MGKEFKIFGKTVTLNLRNEGDFAIANELFLDHQYRFCDETLRKAKNVVIDVGGHLGFFSIYAFLLNSEVPIYAFEPHDGNFALFKKNLKDNRIKNVIAKNLAVSSKVGEIELQISREDLNHSTVYAIEETGEVQKMQSTTLERILEKNKIERCDLLKLDCEGAEFEIIYGTSDEVFKKIDAIFLEYHDWAPGGDHKRLRRFLEAQGYKVEEYPNSKIPELGFLWCSKGGE